MNEAEIHIHVWMSVTSLITRNNSKKKIIWCKTVSLKTWNSISGTDLTKLKLGLTLTCYITCRSFQINKSYLNNYLSEVQRYTVWPLFEYNATPYIHCNQRVNTIKKPGKKIDESTEGKINDVITLLRVFATSVTFFKKFKQIL